MTRTELKKWFIARNVEPKLALYYTRLAFICANDNPLSLLREAKDILRLHDTNAY